MSKLKNNHHLNTDPCFNAFYGERKMKNQINQIVATLI